MTFTRVEMQDWPRREAFEHYFREVPCSYSAVFRLDITRLRRSGKKLYPSMLYRLATVVNRHQELRMALDGEGKVGFTMSSIPAIRSFIRRARVFPTFGRGMTRTRRPSSRPTSGTWPPTASCPA